MTPEKCGHILLKQVGQQIMHYQQLICLSQNQQQMILDMNFSKLPELVDKRNTVTRRLRVINKVVTCYREYWRKTADQASCELVGDVEKGFRLLISTLEELATTDRQLKTQAMTTIGEMRRDIGRIHHGKVVASAYSRPRIQPQPRHISRLSR